MQAAASAASATVQAVAAAHDRAQQEKIRELQAACCAHAATVDELAGQLAREREAAGAAADQVLDVWRRWPSVGSERASSRETEFTMFTSCGGS